MMSFSFQKRVISAYRAGKFMSVGTLLYMLYLLLMVCRDAKNPSHAFCWDG